MKALIASVSFLALSACGDNSETTANYADKANVLAQNTIIIDSHIDVPYRLNRAWEDVTVSTGDKGNFDYPRAQSGGLNAPFMSIYTPAEFDGTPKAKIHADTMIGLVEKLVASAPEKFTITRSPGEVEAAFAAGQIALPLGMENGSPISGDLANLDYFFERGIRYITLAHSKSNHISDSSYDPERQWDGLSPFGEQVVKRMNELGIMVDISHVSDAAFWDVMKISATPVIASHSSARFFTPGFERNMADDMIKALAQKGSVIMINYGSAFVTAEANKYRPTRDKSYAAYLAENTLEDTAELKEKFEADYLEDHPYPYASLDDVLDHFDHVIKIAGIDHVGIGSDYDGVGDSLPTNLKDVASYPALIEGFLKRGYSDKDIEKILSGNLLRVWRTVEAYAVAN